jgi:hypothetical protein
MSEHLDRYMEAGSGRRGDARECLCRGFRLRRSIDRCYTKADIGTYLESLPQGALKFTKLVSGDRRPGDGMVLSIAEAAGRLRRSVTEGAAFSRWDATACT